MLKLCNFTATRRFFFRSISYKVFRFHRLSCIIFALNDSNSWPGRLGVGIEFWVAEAWPQLAFRLKRVISDIIRKMLINDTVLIRSNDLLLWCTERCRLLLPINSRGNTTPKNLYKSLLVGRKVLLTFNYGVLGLFYLHASIKLNCSKNDFNKIYWNKILSFEINQSRS